MPKQTTPGIVVTLTDGRELSLDVSNPPPADLVAFEAHFDVSSEQLAQPNKRVAWSLYLMWRIARRQDPAIMGTDFDTFVEQVAEITEGTTVASVDPIGEEARIA